MKTKHAILIGLAVTCAFWLGFWCAWMPCNSTPPQPEQLIEIQIIYAHHYGDTYKENGMWLEPSTHAIYERADTKERFISCKVLGKAGDVLKAKMSDLKVTCR